MCCAEKCPASQENEKRACHINERFFIESQMIEGVAFAGRPPPTAPRKCAKTHFVAKKAY
jgi:hypothetical protein